MSHINFDFLTDSILFGSNLEDDFEALNEGILREELARYREYVLENFNEIKKEVIMDNRKITVTIESFGKRPDNNILKQLALYIDCVLIADPLFSFTEEKNEINDAWTEYLGIKNDGLIDRKKLSEALKYMKSITNLIVCDYVKFVPISILHEAPKEVPIRCALPDAEKAGLPIVAMTANAFDEDRQNAEKAGMNGHLSKPFDMQQLLAMLREKLSQ